MIRRLRNLRRIRRLRSYRGGVLFPVLIKLIVLLKLPHHKPAKMHCKT